MHVTPTREARGRGLPGPVDLLDCLLRTPVALYAVALGPAALILALAALQPLVPLGHLTRDPMAVAELTGMGRPYYGAVSNLGVLAWIGSAGAGLLGAATRWRAATHRGWACRDDAAVRQALFLACGAVIGSMLALDDLFMIHENHRLQAVRGEEALLGIYGTAIIAYLAVFRGEILGGRQGGLLLLALALLGLSVGVDVVMSDAPMDSLYWAVEDGAKFLGISAWATFQFAAALDAGNPRP